VGIGGWWREIFEERIVMENGILYNVPYPKKFMTPQTKT
jgi:hypothetical protein